MIKNSTPLAFKHCKNSLKSLVKDLGSIIQLTELLQMPKPLKGRLRKPEFSVFALRLGMRCHPDLGAVHAG